MLLQSPPRHNGNQGQHAIIDNNNINVIFACNRFKFHLMSECDSSNHPVNFLLFSIYPVYTEQK